MTRQTLETDVSAWPLVVVTVPNVALTDAMVQQFVEKHRPVIRRREYQALLVDASRVVMGITAVPRKMLAAFLEESRPFTRAVALLEDAPLARDARHR